MVNVLKKNFTSHGQMRVVLALLYLLTTLSIPLSHTCQLAEKDAHNHHTECIGHQFQSNKCAEAHSAVALDQNDITETAKSQNHCCPACLYLLISKASKFCSNASLYSTQTVKRTQPLLQLGFTKQLEWLCSVSLRAPPSITS